MLTFSTISRDFNTFVIGKLKIKYLCQSNAAITVILHSKWAVQWPGSIKKPLKWLGWGGALGVEADR